MNCLPTITAAVLKMASGPDVQQSFVQTVRQSIGEICAMHKN